MEMRHFRLFSRLKRFVHRNAREDRRRRMRDIFHTGNGQRVAIDFSFNDVMSEKELHDLATQVREVYGSNLRAEYPFHLLFTNYNRNGLLHPFLAKKLCKDPLELPIDIREERLSQLFDKRDIVFLTPDASQPLLTLDRRKVYVVGGLADKTVQKHLTRLVASRSGIATRRLPIKDYLVQTNLSYSSILTVNQVFDILLKYEETRDWTTSLLYGIPQRKGFVARQNSTDHKLNRAYGIQVQTT